VINGSPTVSDRARDAVLAAVQALGYVPNQAARSLVTRRTGAVALVIAESDDRIFGEPYFAGIVRGTTEVISGAGRQVVLPLFRRDDREALRAFLTPQHVDGVILLDQDVEGTLPQETIDRRVPIVHGGRPALGLASPYVDTDNIVGARAAVEHLISRGRATIATIAGPPRSTHSNDRLEGYRLALEDHGRTVDPELVEVGEFNEPSGVVAMRRLLERRPDLDADFAANDSMAVGALRVLQESGRSVPDDVAVVGFDDSPIAAIARPALTTVHQPTEEVGRHLARLLLAQIEDPQQAPDSPVLLPTHLVLRAST
jgi:DNA-binding LacI/PurR family transcriptional regulator